MTEHDEYDPKTGGFDPASAAVGAAGIGGATLVAKPARRSPMTNRGRGVRRELERKAKFGGRTKLSTEKFAEISGGRGWRPQNDAYTARLAQAMKQKKVKQNRLILDIYDDNIVQRDGAHRAHAAAMLGRKVKVKAVRHKGEKAPKHITGINALRDEFVQGRHRARLKKLGRSGGLSDKALQAMAGGYKDSSVKRAISHGSSKASASGIPGGRGKLLTPQGAAMGAAVAGTAALAAHRLNKREPVRKSIAEKAAKVYDYPLVQASGGGKTSALTVGAGATWIAARAIERAMARRAEKAALKRSAHQTKALIRNERKKVIPAAVGAGVLAGTAAGVGSNKASRRR